MCFEFDEFDEFDRRTFAEARRLLPIVSNHLSKAGQLLVLRLNFSIFLSGCCAVRHETRCDVLELTRRIFQITRAMVTFTQGYLGWCFRWVIAVEFPLE